MMSFLKYWAFGTGVCVVLMIAAALVYWAFQIGTVPGVAVFAMTLGALIGAILYEACVK